MAFDNNLDINQIEVSTRASSFEKELNELFKKYELKCWLFFTHFPFKDEKGDPSTAFCIHKRINDDNPDQAFAFIRLAVKHFEELMSPLKALTKLYTALRSKDD